MRFGAALVFLTVLLASQSAFAMKFANQFVEFELPYQWKCMLEGADWVCQSEDKDKKRDAIIVLAAKLKGDQDTMDKYTDHLKKPRTFNAPGGKSITSNAKYTANKEVNSHVWVDSLHLESEIPNFFTRYLATTYEDIGVLVTYSVNKAKYQEYSKMFEDMVASLRVFHKKGSLNSGGSPFDNQKAPSGGGIFQPTVSSDTGVATTGRQGGGAAAKGGLGMLALLAVGGIAFFIWKKKKDSGA